MVDSGNALMQKCNAMEWDDLRFFLAVARTGSLASAARALRVYRSTVLRRINALEERLAVRLFERLQSGYVTTSAGDEMLDRAQRIEEEVAAVDRLVTGRDTRLSGTLRVAIPDILALRFLPHLAAFCARFPAITLEVVTGNAFMDLNRRDADVAIRTTNAPSENLIGQRVASAAFALYGSVEYLTQHPAVDDLLAQTWLGWDDSLADIATARWMKREVPGARFALRVNSPTVMLEAVKAGIGITWLFCFVADPEPSLRRIRPPLPELQLGLWLVTHEDLRRTARVRTFLRFMAESIGRERSLIEGIRPADDAGSGRKPGAGRPKV